MNYLMKYNQHFGSNSKWIEQIETKKRTYINCKLLNLYINEEKENQKKWTQ